MLMAWQGVAVCCSASVLQCTSQSRDCDVQDMLTEDRTSIHVLASRSVSAETTRRPRHSFASSRSKVSSDSATLQHTVTHCNKLQHTATHCNTLQHTAIRSLLATFQKAAHPPLAFLPHPSSFLSTFLFTTRPSQTYLTCILQPDQGMLTSSAIAFSHAISAQTYGIFISHRFSFESIWLYVLVLRPQLVCSLNPLPRPPIHTCQNIPYRSGLWIGE